MLLVLLDKIFERRFVLKVQEQLTWLDIAGEPLVNLLEQICEIYEDVATTLGDELQALHRGSEQDIREYVVNNMHYIYEMIADFNDFFSQ